MLLSEFVNDYFLNKEIQIQRREPDPRMEYYGNINDKIKSDSSNVLEFSIKGEAGTGHLIKLSGIVDYANGEFIIRKVDFANNFTINKEDIERLINSVITNLEMSQPNIDIIFWRINKCNSECIEAALNKGFVYEDSNQYTMDLVYYLPSNPIRLSYNTKKLRGMNAHGYE